MFIGYNLASQAGVFRYEKPAPLKTPAWEVSYNYEQLFM